jgi:hypothetical protein
MKADPATIATILAPLPDNPVLAGAKHLSAIDTSKAIKDAMFTAMMLGVHVRHDDSENFLRTYNKLHSQLVELEPAVQAWRYKWASAVSVFMNRAVFFTNPLVASGRSVAYT